MEIECSVATGVGLGSSTCDVVAAIRAVCGAYGVELDAGRVAGLAIEAEGAVDPIMFDGEMVLFAQRQGRVLESFGAWAPRYAVLSIDTDLGRNRLCLGNRAIVITTIKSQRVRVCAPMSLRQNSNVAW